MSNKKLNRGFTLIELLVVIAIIGILASVVLASLNSARERARDAARKAALKEVQKALELYFSDHGTYVVAGSGSACTGVGYLAVSGTCPSVATQLHQLGYMGAPVIDPSGATGGYQNGRSGYMIQATASNYTIWANLESPTTADTATLNTCPINSYDDYYVGWPADARMNYCVGK